MLQEWVRAAGLLELTDLTVAVRLLMAFLFGGMLGLERTRKRRAAGLRTYMLVAIGATVAMMTGEFTAKILDGTRVDATRIASQVVSGIGFIGAGTIMVTRFRRVTGLTTAAGLWAAACMGIAIGIGFYTCAIVMLLLSLVTMTFADKMEMRYTSKLRRMHLYMVFEGLPQLRPFLDTVRGEKFDISDVEINGAVDGHGISLLCTVKMPQGWTHESTMKHLSAFDGVLFTEEVLE